MDRVEVKSVLILVPLLFIISAVAQVALGQYPGKPQTTDDVVRTNTELVQTSVTVFEKQGRLVDGLKKTI